MRSSLVAVVAGVIALAFAGTAAYYWLGGGSSDGPIEGVVIDAIERQAGTESGDNTMAQGLNVLTGKSLQKEVFYFLLVRTEDGDEIEVEVPRQVYLEAEYGDRLRRSAPDATPVLIKPQ